MGFDVFKYSAIDEFYQHMEEYYDDRENEMLSKDNVRDRIYEEIGPFIECFTYIDDVGGHIVTSYGFLNAMNEYYRLYGKSLDYSSELDLYKALITSIVFEPLYRRLLSGVC